MMNYLQRLLASLVLFSAFALWNGAANGQTINVCYNGTTSFNGTVATGGTAPYIYLWESSSDSSTWNAAAGTNNGQSYSVNSPITSNVYYRRKATDNNGCVAYSNVITVNVSAQLVASGSVTGTILCNGLSNGEATASATGGTGSYTYSWNTGETSAVESNLGAGTYSVTITDANGCTDSTSVTITEPSALVAASALDSNVSCNSFSDGGATASATGGTGAYTYLWNNTAPTASITGVVAGTYSVTVTDANGCTDSASITVTEPAALVAASIVDSNASCNTFSDGGATASATGGTGAYSYMWSNTAITASITGVVAGTYSVTVTDANGCTDSASVSITEPAVLLAATALDSNDLGNGGGASASATGGTMSYTYLWSNGANTASITGVSGGTYTVTITDAEGCTSSNSVTVTAGPLVSGNVDNNVSCNGLSDGEATAYVTGGNMPYAYSWSNGGTSASTTGLAAGTYTVTVTDNNGLTDVGSVTITEPAVLIAASVADSNASCNGFFDGGATASATGGTSAYTYIWNNGGTTASITGVAAGTYSVTITDANGCTDSASVNITEPVILIADAILDSNDVGNGGGATASGAGGTGSYNYSWSNGATSASITGVTAGTYSVTITDAQSCTDSASVSISAGPLVSANVDDNVSCNGLSDGEATANVTGGTMPYAYFWSNGTTTASATGLAAGTYTVTVTDNIGLTDVGSVTITEPAVLIAATVVDSNVSCNGFLDGGATASATGGTSAYTYTWNNGGTTASITGVAAGTYSVTITDANGCTDSTSVTITEPTVLIAASVVDSNASCNGFSDGGATASATGGTMSYTYLWSNSATTASITGVVAGTYSVTITDGNGCTDSSSVTVTEPAALIAASVVDSNASCNGFSDGGATASATGGTMSYTYLWSNSATTASITGVVAGTYSVTITDANGCTDSSSVTVTQPSLLVSASVVDSNVSCNSFLDGGGTASATGGTGLYTYSWSNTASTASITGVAAGTYSVTITDANGCTDSSSVTITEPAILTAASIVDSNISCNTFADGGATAAASGGTMPYTFSWSNTAITASITGVVAGTYSVTITDGNGCTDSSSITITEPAALVAASIVDSNTSCNGFSDGGATASATGGTMSYSYLWGNSATTASITGVVAGTYSVTITDANGCTDSSSVTITEPAVLLSSSAVDSNVSCNGLLDGGTTVNATGGTLPYAYAWSNTAITASITGVGAGTYSVTITDANGCTSITSSTITEPAALVSSSLVDSNVTCNGFSNGGGTTSAVGGTMPYNYNWSNGATTSSLTGIVAGTYSVTVTDANGCTDSSSITVTEPAALIAASIVDSNATCNGFSNGGATASATGGTGTYMYSWSNGGNTASITGIASGTYTVTITGANGCTSTSSTTISEPAILTPTAAVDSSISCNGLSDGGATVSVSGGTMPYTYAWSNSATTASITGVMAGTYSVLVTDANGCSASTAVVVTQPTPLFTAITSTTHNLCFGDANGTMTVSATGATPVYTYLWSNGQTSNTATGLMAGNYTVTVTDANGCTQVETGTITQPAQLTSMLLTANDPTCFGSADGQLGFFASGGVPAYSYTWSNGGTGATISGIASGTYTVTITDANGCSITDTASITDPAQVDVTVSTTTNVLCNGGTTGSATVSGTGGFAPYVYSWSTGASGTSATNLAASSYLVTLTDANACTDTVSVQITEPAALIVAVTLDNNASCNGLADGGATAAVTGGTSPYQYAWSGGAGSTSSVSGLAADVYDVTVTDANGCVTNGNVTITEPMVLELMVEGGTTVCFGDATGSAFVTGTTGGTSPYMVSWNTGAAGDTLSNVAAGTYTATLTDANGCTVTADADVVDNAELIVGLVITDANCEGGADGVIDVFATGGNGGYTFVWDNGGVGTPLTNLVDGETYTVTVTDAEGCTAQDNGTVSFTNALPSVNLGNDTAYGIPSLITLNTGAIGNHLWSTGATTNTFTLDLRSDTTIWVRVQNQFGCINSDTIRIEGLLSVEDALSSYEIKLFPNPTNGDLNIQVDNNQASEVVVQVVDFAGKVVYMGEWNNVGERIMHTIDMSRNSQGIYFVNILLDGKLHTERVTVY